MLSGRRRKSPFCPTEPGPRRADNLWDVHQALNCWSLIREIGDSPASFVFRETHYGFVSRTQRATPRPTHECTNSGQWGAWGLRR